jgi:hypothetical protein
MIVEYKMHRNKQGNKIIPFFIADGGYYVDGNKLVGHTVNDGSYIPETLIVLDRDALITRVTNSGYKVYNPDTNEYDSGTAEEIEAHVDAFISKHD